MIIYLIFFNFLFSQPNFDEVDLIGNNGEGTEYIFSIPMPYSNGEINSELKLYSEFNTIVNIESKNFNTKVLLKEGELKSIDLKNHIFSNTFTQQQRLQQNSQINRKSAVKLLAEKPFKAFLTVKTETNSESTFLIPQNLCDTSYVVQTYSGLNVNPGNLSSISTICAFEDSTIIDLTIGGVSSTRIFLNGDTLEFGESKQIILDSKDVLILQNFRDQDFELAGTRVISNKKISLFNANYCSNVPDDTPTCNYLMEVGLGTNYFGKEFYIPYFKDRYYSGLIRVFTIDITTKVYENGKQIISMTNSTPGLKNRSWADYRIMGKSSEIKHSIITSDKPIGIIYLNPSSSDDNTKFKSSMFNVLPTTLKLTKSLSPKLLLGNNNDIKVNSTIIAPLKNNILSDEIFINDNSYKSFKNYYSISEYYENDYSLIEDESAEYDFIWSAEGHQTHNLININESSQTFTVAFSEIGNLRNQRLIDNKSPWLTFFRNNPVSKDSDSVELKFTLNDERSDLYRFQLYEEEKVLIDSFLINSKTRKFQFSHTFTPTLESNYKVLAIDNSNNFEWFDLGKLRPEIIIYDTLELGIEDINFGLVQVGDSSKINIPFNLISSDKTNILSISLIDSNITFSLDNELILPTEINPDEQFSINITYKPNREYTKAEFNDEYGYGDYAKLVINTTNSSSTYTVFGKGGIARIYWRYDNNSFIDTLSQGSELLLNNNKFFIQNYNISTKENGTYNLIIDKINLDSIYNINNDEVDLKNFIFDGKFKHNEEGFLLEPIVIAPGDKIYFNEDIKFVGDEAGEYSFFIPLNSNAVNNSEFGILFFEFIVFENTNTVKNLKDLDFKINNNILTISSKKKISSISINNLLGKCLYECDGNLTPINLQDISEKVILVRVSIENEVYVGKVLLN